MNMNHPLHFKIFTGIGPRSITSDTEKLIVSVSEKLYEMGYVLRSGGAWGSDTKFEEPYVSSPDRLEVYLPWNGFNSRVVGEGYYLINKSKINLLYSLVNFFHPNSSNLRYSVRSLMMRNCHQVLGYELNIPSQFVLIGTDKIKLDKNSRIYDCDGGTGFAVRLAYANNIPVYSLTYKPHQDKIFKGLNINKD